MPTTSSYGAGGSTLTYGDLFNGTYGDFGGRVGSDTGAGAEGTSTLYVSPTADSGSATESWSITATPATVADASSGTDDWAVAATPPASSDSASATKTWSIAASLDQSDSGSASETWSIEVAVASSDAGTLLEGTPSSTADLTQADTAVGIELGGVDEQWSIDAQWSSSDSGSATETETAAKLIVDSDSASATDGFTQYVVEWERILSVDLERGTEISDQDSGAFEEALLVLLDAADTATSSDEAGLASTVYVDELITLELAETPGADLESDDVAAGADDTFVIPVLHEPLSVSIPQDGKTRAAVVDDGKTAASVTDDGKTGVTIEPVVTAAGVWN